MEVTVNRRDLMMGAIVGAAISGPETGHAALSSQQMRQRRRGGTQDAPGTDIEAPNDVIVLSIVGNGPVKKGQTLISMRSFQLEQAEIQITLHQQHLAVLERSFVDCRIDAEIKLLQEKASSLEEQLKLRANVVAVFDSGERFGTSHAQESANADAMVQHAQTKSDYLSAKLSAEQAVTKKQDALDKIALGKSKLASLGKLLDERKKALTIVASTTGNFTAKTGVGLSVMKGNLLGEIVS
jgi:hypothetical protein